MMLTVVEIIDPDRVVVLATPCRRIVDQESGEIIDELVDVRDASEIARAYNDVVGRGRAVVLDYGEAANWSPSSSSRR